MNEPQATEKLTLIQLLPNMLTVIAICAGMTAVRFGLQGSYEIAVQLILLAAVLDGMDGRLARALKSESGMGAELDSLADFFNFGVAPGMLLYNWALTDSRSFGWLAVLAFAVCACVRLARFNVQRKSEDKAHDNAFFTGVPSPAGALLVMLPMYLSFGLGTGPLLPDVILALWMVICGLSMISRFPTWSFKTTRIPRKSAKFFLVAVALAGAAAVTYAWITLVIFCIAYIAAVIIMLPRARRRMGKGAPE
ncbi:CDP-diacylglycerol--serine O-phosphatidyltransferase [Citreicella sp. C3M06]|uniref:CDP-diacylglycerol--serine O-phosphatidyltransferase n=1 Tax=Roseobacteraceae TaxID=2854170 RepID=UPI001C086A0F|nr:MULTISPECIES: CDP-diacylglycerol--serine O-phosphatidyltransferase [Roseobacteraceae]MBU2959557.1 CDP-diacylglycerol--serine O-phosphatidyltransferase [Citreicella sp. C3M06]MDO6587094.1 CDP-diacylglycerol--serine O-phosphatidyltransferase [Salipiger sp. 1_MG-2023]